MSEDNGNVLLFPGITLAPAQLTDPPASFEEMILRVSAECIAIMIERQKKYGPKNISKRGEMGILTRLDDKLARLDTSSGDFADESRNDTWVDVANYALIALCVRHGWWTEDGCPPLLPEH